MYIPDGNAQERNKYAEIWSIDQYRKAHSPGLQNVDRFMEIVAPQPGQSLYDVGCGSGSAGLKFAENGLRVTYVDITPAGLEPQVPMDHFIEAPLWGLWAQEQHNYAFCCDVMEHIPTEYVMLTLDNILQSCELAWFQICHLPDEYGKLIGEPLHLTVRPHNWWLVRLATLSEVIDARDLCGSGLYIVKGNRYS